MAADSIRVQVVWARKEECICRSLEVQAGTCAADVVRQSGLLEDLSIPYEQLAGIGVWGRHLDGRRRLSPEEYPVQEGDRIEIYRPLPVSPGEARKRRARAQRELD